MRFPFRPFGRGASDRPRTRRLWPPKRRQFTAEYRLRVLALPGERLLRREGLYGCSGVARIFRISKLPADTAQDPGRDEHGTRANRFGAGPWRRPAKHWARHGRPSTVVRGQLPGTGSPVQRPPGRCVKPSCEQILECSPFVDRRGATHVLGPRWPAAPWMTPSTGGHAPLVLGHHQAADQVEYVVRHLQPTRSAGETGRTRAAAHRSATNRASRGARPRDDERHRTTARRPRRDPFTEPPSGVRRQPLLRGAVQDPEVPPRHDITAAIAFCRTFFPWYNTEHRHGGSRCWRRLRAARADPQAASRHPERFDPTTGAVDQPTCDPTTGETAQ